MKEKEITVEEIPNSDGRDFKVTVSDEHFETLVNIGKNIKICELHLYGKLDDEMDDEKYFNLGANKAIYEKLQKDSKNGDV